MLDFLALDANLPFAVALALAVMLGVLEVVGLLFGMVFSQGVDAVLPDATHALPDWAVHSLDWLGIGKLPMVIWLMLFLLAFSATGLFAQALVNGIYGAPLSPWLASLAATLLSLPVVRVGGQMLSRVLPKDETEVVSIDSLIGRTATITLGVAKRHAPAQAKVADVHGRTHYVMVEPAAADHEFPAGTPVLLVERHAHVFRGEYDPSRRLQRD